MRFVILGDLHYSFYLSRRLSTLRDEFYTRLFERVAAIQADAVFFIGDVSHTSQTSELVGLREIAHRAGVRHYYMVNGNHDLFRLTPEKVAQYNDNPQPSYFALHLDEQGQAQPSAQPNTKSFLVLNTAQYAKPLDTAGLIDPKQLDWLAQQVDLSQRDEPLFVLGHHPLYNLTKWASLAHLSIRNSSAVWEALAQKREGVGFYFCGHNHTNSQARRENWVAIQTAAPLVSLGFRLVEVKEQCIETSLIEIGGGEKVARAALLLSVTQANITNFLSGEVPMVAQKPLRISW
ncbi:MAG: metallophosphoesterase [Chloroflexota bacterium]|nr:metallophosphoesterase [Chloroflexota bacterium]